MCYSGKCKYEQHMGDCGLKFEVPMHIPEDAACAIADKEIEKIENSTNRNNTIKGLFYKNQI